MVQNGQKNTIVYNFNIFFTVFLCEINIFWIVLKYQVKHSAKGRQDD